MKQSYCVDSSGLKSTGTRLYISIRWILCLAILALSFGVANSAHASHFRGGAVSWVAADLDNDGVEDDAVLTFKTAWRSDFVSSVSLSITPSGPAESSRTESVVFVGGAETEADSDYAFQTTVIEVLNFNIGTEYLVNYKSGNRIVELENNGNTRWNIQTIVQLADDNLPPTIEFPIIYEVPQLNPDGSTLDNWTFDVDAIDPNADSVRYRMATAAELGAAGSTNPVGLGINSTSGLITWSGSGNLSTGLYSGGIIAEDFDSSGNLISKSHVDFILDLKATSAYELTRPSQISDSRNEIVEKGDSSSFSFDDNNVSIVSLGDAQGAIVETSDNNFTFTAGAEGSPLDPGVYPITFEVNEPTNNFSNAYYSVNFIVKNPDGPIVLDLQDDRTPYFSPGTTVFIDSGQDATITDRNNTNFNGGNLKLNLSNSDYTNETLSINSVGAGVGEISISGSTVSYEGVLIGSIDATLNGVNDILSIDFTSTAATLDAVEALIRQLTYSNSVTAADRDLTLRLEDSDGDYNFYSLYLQEVSLDNSQVSANPDSTVADNVATSTITVALFDNSSRALRSSGGVVTISSDIGSVSAVTDNNDGTYTATITSGTDGEATISATANGGALADTAKITFLQPVAPSSSTVSLSASSAVVDTLTTITVQGVNASGDNVAFGGDNVVISTTLGTVSLVTDNSDGSYTATITHPATGVATISATINGGAASNTQTLNFIAGSPDASNSTLSLSSATATTDESLLVTAQLIDSNGNAITSGGETVVFSASEGLITATTDVGDGRYTATLSKTTPGTSTVTATVNGTLISDSESATFSTGAATTTTSTLSVSATSATTDDSVMVSLQAVDANGNAISNGGDTVVFSTTTGTVSSVTDNNDGSYTALLISSTPGTATLSALLNGALVDDTETVNFSVGAAAPATSSLSVNNTTPTTDDTVNITVQIFDAQNNPRSAGGDSVVISASLGSVSSTTDNGNGTYTATLSSSSTGSSTVSATVNSATLADTESVSFSAGAADASTSLLSVSDSTPTTDDSVTVTLRAVDSGGNSRTTGGDNVVFSTTAGAISAATDAGNGTYTATLTNTSVGNATVTASINATNLSDSELVTFSAGGAQADTSTLTVSSQIATTDDTLTITLQTVDANGNPNTTGGESVAFSTTLGSISQVTDNSDGTYTALLSSTTTGTAAVSANLNNSAVSQTQSVSFSAGAATSAMSALSVSTSSASTDDTVIITLQSVDSGGNNRSTGGEAVIIGADGGTVSSTNDNGDGTFTATLSSSATGEINISATIDGNMVSDTESVNFSAGAAATSTSLISASSASATTDETVTITVQAADAFGNLLDRGGDSFVITTDQGSVSETTDNSDGTYTAILNRTTTGVSSASATLSGLSIDAATDVIFTPGAATSSTSILTVSNSTPSTDDTVDVSVQTVDAAGNDRSSGGDDIVISSTLGTLSAVVDNGDGSYSATLSSTLPGEATVAYTINSAEGAQSETVQFSVGDATADTSVLSVAQEEITTVESVVVTLQTRDQYGNELTEGGATAVFQSDLGTLGSPVIDNSDGSYQVTLKSDIAGTATIVATLNDASVNDDVSVEIVPDQADPGQSTISASPEELIADGTSTSTVTLTTRDASLNRLASGGDTVVLTTDLGTISDVTDNNDGSYTATFTAPSRLGQTDAIATITSTVNSDAGPDLTLALSLNASGDEDGDGILNSDEDVSLDSDQDGIPDYLDEDDDNDGISTLDEGAQDPDEDDSPNYLDTDSDNDGIPDYIEADRNDDGDLIPNYLDTDSDNDGIPDSVETSFPVLSQTDSDADGIDDVLDVDITQGEDIDLNGIDDRFDPIDSDNDDVPDYTDIDSDGDGIPDTLEGSGDADEDGVADYLDEDSNNDGIPDQVAANISGNDTDQDGVADEFDVDNTGGIDANGDGVDDNASLSDQDDDGEPDVKDSDIDGDGVNNNDDVFPQNPGESGDADGDGLGDNEDIDDDNDGYTDEVEAQNGTSSTDSESLPAAVDSDGDLIADSLERGKDSDGDGIEDYQEVDSDNDGIYDHIEASSDTEIARQNDLNQDGLVDAGLTGEGTQLLFSAEDTDGDGVEDYRDLDSDNDGISDRAESATEFIAALSDDSSANLPDPSYLSVQVDSDSDAIENFRDLDSDNDGIPDLIEAGGIDIDGDARQDSFLDANGDGYHDELAANPLAIPDTDSDGLPDFIDLDSDQDSLSDIFETTGADFGSDGRIDEFVDLDGDGLHDLRGDYNSTLTDTDNDGVLNYRDIDSDNDGVFDVIEAGRSDENNDGRVDIFGDSDADGIPDDIDIDVTGGVDTDSDGIDDRFDLTFVDLPDADQDGIPDEFDADANGDGLIENDESGDPILGAALPDIDGDGTPDVFDQSTDRVHIGLSGSGCSIGSSGKPDPFLWILIIVAIACRLAMKMRRKIKSRVVCLLVMVCGMTIAGVTKADYARGPYLGFSVLGTSLEPQIEGTNFEVDDSISSGWAAYIGYRFHRRWRTELDYANLGEASLSPAAEVTYADTSVSVLYDALHFSAFSVRNNLTLYGRIGAGQLSGEGDLQTVEDSSMQVLFGIGVDVSTRKGLSLRAEALSYDEDANRIGMSLLYRFGAREPRRVRVAEQTTKPIAVAETAQLKTLIPEPELSAAKAVKPTKPVSRLVMFERGSNAMDKTSRAVVTQLVREKSDENSRWIITGHTDSSGGDAYNRLLSLKRAQAVRRQLIAQGVNPQSIKTLANGSDEPIADNISSRGQARNRRVEVKFIK